VRRRADGLTASAAARARAPRRAEAVTEGALDLAREDQPDGVAGERPERLERRPDVCRRRRPPEPAARAAREEMDQLTGGDAEAAPEDRAAAHRGVDVDAAPVEREGDVEQARAARPVRRAAAAARPLDDAEPHERGDRGGGVRADAAGELGGRERPRPVVRPGPGEALAEPQAACEERGIGRVGGEHVADRTQVEATRPERADQTQALDVPGVVHRRPAAARRRREHPLRLVEADRAGGEAGDGGELIDGVAGGFGGDAGLRRFRAVHDVSTNCYSSHCQQRPAARRLFRATGCGCRRGRTGAARPVRRLLCIVAGGPMDATRDGWRIRFNRFVWRAHVFVASTLVVVLERLFPGRGHGQRLFARSARVTNRLVGVRVEVRGREKLDPGQAYVITPNHRSHLDITAVMAAFPTARFAAKRELFDEPVLGAAMRALGMIAIDRQHPALAKQALAEAAAGLGRAVSVVIFPEGTRAPAGRMLPFKSGPFVLAIDQQLPLVPVAVHNTAQAMPAHGHLTIHGGRVVVEILDPVPTVGLGVDDRDAVKERVRAALVGALRPADGGAAERPDLGPFERGGAPDPVQRPALVCASCCTALGVARVRAALLEEPGRPLVVRDDVVIADPGPGQVRVRVRHCGVCHSDLSLADGVFPVPTPIVLGHEAAGVVDAVGADVDGLAPGDPVVLTPVPPCGRCYFCVRGEPGVCVNASMIATNTFRDGSTGLSRGGAVVYRGVGLGGFAEYALVPAAGAIAVAPDVPLDVACVIGCAVQTGVGAVLNTARVEAGASVLVMGLGGVGSRSCRARASPARRGSSGSIRSPHGGMPPGASAPPTSSTRRPSTCGTSP
jgi:1-acyl-sn-glycerol-3-phosphate acyltransferase